MSEKNPFTEALERAEKVIACLYGGLNDIEMAARHPITSAEDKVTAITDLVKRTRERAHHGGE